MGWKHRQSHPQHLPQTIYQVMLTDRRAVSVPSLQLGCDAASQLPSHWASSVYTDVRSFGGRTAERQHAADGFIWDARWHTVWACACVFGQWMASGKSPNREIRCFHIPQDDRRDVEREAQSITSEEICQIYCTVQTRTAPWPTSLTHTH